MDKFIAEFDPLVTLEAEYAAVVARTRVRDADPAEDDAGAAEQTEKREDEPAESEDDDEASSLGEELYAPLAADSDDEYEDPKTDEDEFAEPAVVSASPAPAPPTPTPMDETTKQTIMASMQSLQLQPPPWARDAAIPDDELLELVQRRLRNSVQPQQQQ